MSTHSYSTGLHEATIPESFRQREPAIRLLIRFWRSSAAARLLYRFMKRVFDFLASLLAIIVLFPVLVLAAVAIRLCDGGPVLFRQQRVGKGGRTFQCYKFRSMILEAEQLQEQLCQGNQHSDPRTFKMTQDPRVTAVGRVLRRFSIDELPQLANVLMGQMSIVGPRPPLPREVVLYTKSDWRRLAVKPGLTCIWQVSGRSRLPFPEQVRLDVQYIRTQSMSQDLSIILKTIPAVLSGDGAV